MKFIVTRASCIGDSKTAPPIQGCTLETVVNHEPFPHHDPQEQQWTTDISDLVDLLALCASENESVVINPSRTAIPAGPKNKWSYDLPEIIIYDYYLE